MRILLFIWLIIYTLTALDAQQKEVADYDYYELSDGLQNRIVNEIVKDQNGYYWLNLPNGVQVFDGTNFTRFIGYAQADFVSSISADHRGVFVLTKDMNILLHTDHNAVAKNIEIPDKSITGDLISFSKNEAAHNYFMTNQGDNYYFYKNLEQPILIDSIVSDIAPSAWLYFNDAIYRFDNKTLIKGQDNVIYQAHKTQEKSSLKYDSHAAISGTSLIISLSDTPGVITVDNNDNTKIINDQYNLSFIASNSSDQSLLGLNDGQYLYVSKFGVWDDINQSLELFDCPSANSNTFKCAESSDYTQGFICGSFNGLHDFNFPRRGINTLFREDVPKSHFGAVIRDFESIDGDIYFIREGGDFIKYNEVDGYQYLERNNYLGQIITQIEYDAARNKFWFLSFDLSRNAKLVSYDPISRVKSIKALDVYIEGITIQNDEELLITGKNGNDGVFITYDLNTETVASRVIIEDTNLNHAIQIGQKLWIAADEGLIIKDLITDVDSLHDDMKNAKFIQKIDELIFVHTHGNGSYVFENNELVKHLSQTCCLSNNFTTGVLQDEQGFFWIGTFNGLSILNPKLEPVEYLYTDDGISSNEQNTRAIVSENGYLYFGSINGITKINPEHALHDYQAKHDFKTRVSYRKNESTSEVKPNNSQYLIFGRPDQVNIAINSSVNAIDLIKKIDIKIVPSSQKFNTSGDNIILKELSFSNISVEMIDRLSGDTLQTVTIQVKPNYPHFWSILSTALLVAGVSFFLARFFIRKNRLKEEEKTELIKKMSEVELEALRSQMNPHFIFNSLGSIQHYIVLNEKKLAGKYLSKFAHLMRMFLDSSKSRNNTLERIIKQLSLYLELEKLRFENKFDYEINVDPNIDLLEEELPSMILQPFVENAILHGINHKTEGKGWLKLLFKMDDDNLVCIIDDNGIGRKAATAIKAGKKMSHQPRALNIIRDRIAIINKLEDRKISLQYIDKEDDDSKSLGTRVIVTFMNNNYSHHV